MHLFTVLNTALIASVVTAATTINNSPSSKSLALHEKRSVAPASSWSKRSQAPRDSMLPIRITIKPQNVEAGHDILMDISNPSSANFGKHWTAKQVHDFFSPSKESVQSVREWLESNGIRNHRHKIALSRNHVMFYATVDEAESLLGTQYNIWENDSTGETSISCDEYHVSADIQHHIDFITPTIGLDAISFSRLTKRNKRRAGIRNRDPARSIETPIIQKLTQSQTFCADRVTPDCIKALYEIPSITSNEIGNDLGLYENTLSYAQKDLDMFFSQYAPYIPNGTHPLENDIDGGSGPVKWGYANPEADLDIQMVYPIIYPQNVQVYQIYGDTVTLWGLNYTGRFNQFLDAIDASYCVYDGGDDPIYDPTFPDGKSWNHTAQCGRYKPTNVISISYNVAEDADSHAYNMRQCHEYMKLGLMGTSVIVSSGDNGTLARFPDGGCLANGAQRPTMPASCPYVTTVGGTQLPPHGTANDTEIAVIPNHYNGFFSSGGGFSNVFPRPSYQDEAVLKFLSNETGLPQRGTYNASSRGYPDVSAASMNIAYVADNMTMLGSGTSASSPIFAGIINLINGVRIASGKGSIGFLNPILYSNADVFNDITGGYNLGCNAETGFYAGKGWDPVTGLGTPNYVKLRNVLYRLP